MPNCIFIKPVRKYARIEFDHINLEKKYDKVLCEHYETIIRPRFHEIFMEYCCEKSSYSIHPLYTHFHEMPIENAELIAKKLCSVVEVVTGKNDIYIKTYYRKKKPEPRSLYILKDANSDHIKIGISDNPYRRAYELPQKIDLENSFYITDSNAKIKTLERVIHRAFKDKNVALRKRATGHTEWFNIGSPEECKDKLHDIIKALCVNGEWVKIGEHPS